MVPDLSKNLSESQQKKNPKLQNYLQTGQEEKDKCI